MYLSKMRIKNFRGIRDLAISFQENLNVIVGENGHHKSSIIDSIRLLYSLGNPKRTIYIGNEDFYTDLETGEPSDKIEISYEFRGLSEPEKGALYQYILIKDGDEFASINITYTYRSQSYPKFSYYTGAYPGQKADGETFEIFQHYYLGALRDSTSDLLRSRNNPLGSVINRSVERNKTESTYTGIVRKANEDLLKNKEVSDIKQSINTNLSDIHTGTHPIDLHIEQTKVDYIVNTIKPYLPFSNPSLPGQGLTLRQNSLGHNNLVYIATVLGDMQDRIKSDDTIHFALLIEEPEAHLHPQLQLNLYNFLKDKNTSKNCQMFITSHSPTMTSRVELENLFVIGAKSVNRVGESFNDREGEGLEDNGKSMTATHYLVKRNMLERYLDVTKSQLFFARAILMVEGISEELLFSVFAQLEGFRLEERDIELVQTGTSFYPFLYLFNSTDDSKRLPQRVAVVTDDDRFTDSKKPEFAFSRLIENNYHLLESLYESIEEGDECTRIRNLEHTRNNQTSIGIYKAYKTLEYEIALANVSEKKDDLESNRFVKYIVDSRPEYFKYIQAYLVNIDQNLNLGTRRKIALLLWKLMPGKAVFAQDFARNLYENLEQAKKDFKVPKYIQDAFKHLNRSL